MRPRIGIIGGAGPSAGALLFERIIKTCQSKYGCARDQDFPYIIMLNYPFADMLTNKKDQSVVANQLMECFSSFSKNDISIAAIACNTLHAFLPDDLNGLHLVHMIEETRHFLTKQSWENPLILCSSTSKQRGLHTQYFPCHYPFQDQQVLLDDVIDRVTAGCNAHEASDEINALLDEETIVLGCTEFSLLHEKAPLKMKNVCDPTELVAEKLCELIFKNKLANTFE